MKQNLALLILLLSACGGGSGNEDPARLRKFNAVVNVPVIVSEDGDKSEDLNFRELTSYADAAEVINVTITSSLSPVPILEEDFRLRDRVEYTLVYSGRAPDIEAELVGDDNQSPEGNAFKFRVLNFSPTAGRIDVYVVNSGAGIENLNPTISRLNNGSASDYVEGEPTTADIIVTSAGESSIISRTLSVELDNGRIYSLLLTDSFGGGTPIIGTISTDR